MNARLLLLLRHRLRPYRGRVAVLVVLQLLQTAGLLYLPTVNADIIDNGVLAGDTAHILDAGAIMVGITVGQVACLLGAVRLAAYVALSAGRDLRGTVFERVLDFSAREVGALGTPSLITRTVNDVQQVQAFVLAGLTFLVSAPVMGVGGVLLALGQDVPLALLLLAMVPFVGALMFAVVRRLRPLQRAVQRCVDTMNRVLREQIAGVRVIRAFCREDHERRRFAVVNAELADVGVRAGRLTTLMLPLATTAMNLFGVPLVWLGAYRVDVGSMRVGALAAFLGYVSLILVGIIGATFTLMSLPRAEASAERIAEVLETDPALTPPRTPVRSIPRPGHLDVRGVDFRLPGAEKPVLRGVDLVARPGETTAVVGSTGSGKSTLLTLVARLADVDAGQILVGGVDVRDLDRTTLSRAVGLVPQEAVLFSGTVATNLRFGRPGASDADLWRALEVAQAEDFVMRLGGLDAEIERGARLSGGQRQRLAIARALVLRPRIYLFDDAFSALDHETESRVRESLADEIADAAVVMVSQRVATTRYAERVVVMDAGAVVGTGTHDELLATNGVYREIVQSQLAGERA